jgi:ribosome recycling factor
VAVEIGDAEKRMQKAIEALKYDLQTIRTGRASPTVLERVQVDYYGTPTALFQIAGITTPDPRSLLIHPYERKFIAEIERAIQKSDLGFNPSNDGNVIRIAVPPPTTQRRHELAKLTHKRVEEAKVAIRNCRRDMHDHIKKLERDHEISADEAKRGQEQLQKSTDGYVNEADRVGAVKQAEIMEV